MDFGKRLKTEREGHGMTQADLARKCGFHPTYISHCENGTRKPSLDNFIKIVNALETSADWLLSAQSSASSKKTLDFSD